MKVAPKSGCLGDPSKILTDLTCSSTLYTADFAIIYFKPSFLGVILSLKNKNATQQ
jgi:hypothetical protein